MDKCPLGPKECLCDQPNCECMRISTALGFSRATSIVSVSYGRMMPLSFDTLTSPRPSSTALCKSICCQCTGGAGQAWSGHYANFSLRPRVGILLEVELASGACPRAALVRLFYDMRAQ